MSRPIDADALIPKLKAIHEAENQIYRRESWGFSLKCINAVEDAPTIVPGRKKGYWILRAEGSMFPFMCDQCGERQNSTSDFCPDCGADMRGERDER